MKNLTDPDGQAVDLEQLGELSVDIARRRFDGKWVLMRVTECDPLSANLE